MFLATAGFVGQRENETIRNQALNAILSIVKSYPAAQDAFLEYDGFSVLMRTLQSEVEKLQIKTARMLNKIILSRKEFQGMKYIINKSLQIQHSSHYQ
ncbi:hsp70-binding protein 1-like [Saccoglossus kowalevskii]